MTELAILYRGPLSSCNYDCAYCPFAKHVSSAEELAKDRASLQRFVQWCEQAQSHGVSALGVLMTPWGEALVRAWYREAVCALSHLSHVRRVAVQTNLSCGTQWLKACNAKTTALWATFHPSEVTLDRFVSRCEELLSLGISFSVGGVGMDHHIDVMEQLRARLPSQVYVWINADKRSLRLNDVALRARWEAIDPFYTINTVRHESLGKPCRTGASVISVDGDGVIRRCHFVSTELGSLYASDPLQVLKERACPNATCSCHIGYVHLDSLGLRPVYGDGILERIPEQIELEKRRLSLYKNGR